MRKKLGVRIQSLINERGQTNRFVAQKCGYSENQLCDMLHGRKIIRPEDVAKLCMVLEVDPNTLFGYDAEHKTAEAV